MQINQDFTIQKVGDNYVAVPVGETSRTFHGMIRLNETGAFLWKLLAQKDRTEEELVDALVATYEVERGTAETDVRHILGIMKENKILL